MSSHTMSLHGLADGLTDTFPAANDAPLARALLALLAQGERVTDEHLAAEIHRPVREVTSALGGWPNVQRDGGGRVVAFSGLSLRPTEHRFEVAGRELFTWCAWDTLFLPALLDESAEVRSTCPLSRTPIQLRVGPGGVADPEPADVWVSFPPLATTSTADIVESFCCHVHFIAGGDTAQRWMREHPGGRVLDLRDAYEVGQRATARLRPGRKAAPE
jgi:alkylmercury lyase